MDLFGKKEAARLQSELVEANAIIADLKRRPVLHCAFCGKSQFDVHKLVAGREHIGICDECIDLAKQLVDELRAGA